VLSSVADSTSRFIVIDIGAYGKHSDGGIFSASTLYHMLIDAESALPNTASFERSGTEMPLVTLGDWACPVKTSVLKPFARRDLWCEERAFNYRL